LQTTSAGKLTRDSSAYAALSEGFRFFEKDLSKLQNFIEIKSAFRFPVCEATLTHYTAPPLRVRF
jgi:hypothetical protein